MKKRKTLKYILALGVISYLLPGCFDEVVIDTKDAMLIDNPLSVEAPVANVHITAKKLLDMAGADSIEFLEISDGSFYPNGLIYGHIDSVIDTTLNVLDFLDFEDQSDQIAYNMPSFGVETEYLFNSPPVNPSPEQKLYSIDFTGGEVSFGLKFPAGYTGSANIEVQGIQDAATGDPLIKSFPVEVTDWQDTLIQLENTIINFDQGVDSSFLKVKLKVLINSTGTPDPADKIELRYSMSGIEPNTVKGYFGFMEPVKQSIETSIPFFADMKGQFGLKEIRMQLDAKNYIGVPIRAVVDSGYFTKTTTGETKLLKPINLDILASPSPSEYKENNIVIDSTNSNITEVMEILPDSIALRIKAQVNPEQNIEDTNFITQINRFVADFALDVPLWFRAQDFEFSDTMAFDFVGTFGDSSMIKDLNEAILEFNFENGFPFGIELSGIYQDSLGNQISKVKIEPIGKNFLEPATVDSEGKLINGSISSPKVSLSKSEVDNLVDKKASEIVFKMKISTTDASSANAPYVQFTETNYLKLGLKVSASINEFDLNE